MLLIHHVRRWSYYTAGGRTEQCFELRAFYRRFTAFTIDSNVELVRIKWANKVTFIGDEEMSIRQKIVEGYLFYYNIRKIYPNYNDRRAGLPIFTKFQNLRNKK